MTSGRQSKRQRQKERKEIKREFEQRRSRRNKGLKIFGFVGLPLIIVLGVLLFVTSKGDEEDSTPKACSAANEVKPQTETFNEAGNEKIDPDKFYVATLDTSIGTIRLQLDAKAAPESVNSFVFLARKCFYNGLTFSRVASDFVIQAGSPTNDSNGGPGYSIQAELPENGYALGTVAWAKAGQEPAGTAGSQFFIVTGNNLDALNTKLPVDPSGDPATTPADQLSYQYGFIGTVLDGLPVAQQIMGFAPETGDGPPTTEVFIRNITIDVSDTEPTSTTEPSLVSTVP